MKRTLLFLLPLLALSCKIGSTGEALITYTLTGQGTPEATSFESKDGWQVELDEATLVMGPLYLCSHVPTFSTKGADSLTDCGKTMGEFSGATLFDALSATPQELGTVDGLSGQINSLFYDHGWLWLQTMGEPEPVMESEHSLRITGTATKDASAFDFVFEIDLKPISKGLQTVMGVAVDYEGDTDTSNMTITADPRRWLRNVNFGPLYDFGEDPLVLNDEMGTYNTLYFGLTSSSPLEFSWKELN